MMTIREWLNENGAKYSNVSERYTACAKELKVSRDTVIHKASKMKLAGGVVAGVVKGKTLADFRAAYDKSTIIPAKLKAGIAALGNEGWEYESAFAKMADVSCADLSAFRDQFADYVVTLKKDSRRAWAGSIKTAKLMREML